MGNRKKMKLILSIVGFILLVGLVFGDVPGSKDHPLLSRYPGSTITYYSQEEFNEFYILICNRPQTEQLTLENVEKLKVEGKVTKIQYSIPKGRSAYEVFKNYELAIKGAGFDILCEGKAKGLRGFLEKTCGFRNIISHTSENPNEHFYLSAQNPDRDKFVAVYVGEGYAGRPAIAAVAIVELKQMETGLITVKDIKERLETSGHVALYGIYFDFNSANIKPESESVLKEVAKFLRENPEIKIYVVGHTDNIGDFEYNMELSRKRAEAVVKELVEKYGIEKSRLKAFGVGPLCPVASNKTEEGRAKNRRVEIVEQ